MIKLFTVVLAVTSSAFAFNLPVKTVRPNTPATLPMAVVASPTKAVSRPATVPNTPSVSVKSFKEWKDERVQSTIKKVTITKAQIEYKKLNRQFLPKSKDKAGEKDLELERLENTLKNDIYALDFAQELGVADYFAGYLTIQENKTDAYKQAAEKMTPDEVNELIKAYADSMFTTNSPSPSGAKVGPTAMEKAALSKASNP